MKAALIRAVGALDVACVSGFAITTAQSDEIFLVAEASGLNTLDLAIAADTF